MAEKRTRANGERSIFPYRNGYAAYVRVDTPDGKHKRKYVYGRTREIVHDKRVKLHGEAAKGPVPTSTPTLATYLDYWLREVVEPEAEDGRHVRDARPAVPDSRTREQEA